MKRIWLLLAGVLHAAAQSNPAAASFATYLGGPSSAANSVAVDPAGFVYVSGVGSTTELACTIPASPQPPGGFVMKLQPRGDGVVWTACLPGLSGVKLWLQRAIARGDDRVS